MFLRNFNNIGKYNVIRDHQAGCVARIQFYLKSLRKYLGEKNGSPYIATSGVSM